MSVAIREFFFSDNAVRIQTGFWHSNHFINNFLPFAEKKSKVSFCSGFSSAAYFPSAKLFKCGHHSLNPFPQQGMFHIKPKSASAECCRCKTDCALSQKLSTQPHPFLSGTMVTNMVQEATRTISVSVALHDTQSPL